MNIIFHLPNKIYKEQISGSKLRPVKMLQAFKDLNYNVYEVVGAGKQRAEAIRKLKNKIEAGLKIDFMYSESSTYPTLLASGTSDFFKYFNQDFSFFKFINKHSIPIGLYYRDIHWLFPHGKGKHGYLKEKIFHLFYKYDLKKYEKLVDALFLPSTKMYQHLTLRKTISNYSLPPGADIKSIKKIKSDGLNLVYVGGMSSLYKMDKLFPVLNRCDFVTCNISTREQEWNMVGNKYILNDNIHIFHYSGDKLKSLFAAADIGLIFTEPHDYWDFAMPVKLYEYLSFGLPIIAIKNTAVGDFVYENKIGWVIDYKEESLKELLHWINENRHELEEKKKTLITVAQENSWINRAQQVKVVLYNNKK